VPVDEPLIETSEFDFTDNARSGEVAAKASDRTRAIGENIASLVEDGSTIEVGIGRIPAAVVEFLMDKKDLGIHTRGHPPTRSSTSSRRGLSPSQKSTDRGKIRDQASPWAPGKLYDYVNNNPIFSFQSHRVRERPVRHRQQNKMVAINTALEIDLTGQVCARLSWGLASTRASAGRPTSNMGAGRSVGGRAIIALPFDGGEGHQVEDRGVAYARRPEW